MLLPTLCFNQQDAELWESDPHEYVRNSFNTYQQAFDPRMAVMKFCTKLGKSRKDTFPVMINYFFKILVEYEEASRGNQQPPLQLCCRKEGAMGALGQLADLLRKSRAHKTQLENFLVKHILPDVSSPHGFIRYRVCWMLQQFSEVRYKAQLSLITSCGFL